MTTWLITGCSTGLGRSLASAVLQAGLNAVVTARDASSIQDIVSPYPGSSIAAALDVRNAEQIREVIHLANQNFSGIDVLVNNAGYGYRAAVEEGDEQEVSDLFATNFFGTVSVIKAALPSMRARRTGVIVNISSSAGRRAMPGSGYYSATKFAIDGMSDALRKELKPLGLKVLVVNPGGFRTDFAGRSLQQARANISDYSTTAGPRRKENQKADGQQPGDPKRAAAAIMRAVADPNMPFRLVLGSDAYRGVLAEVEEQRTELLAWKDLSASTDF